MRTLCDAADRAGVLARLERLTPQSRALWGRLTPPRLLCHLSDGMRVALGEVPVVRRDTLLHRTLLQWLVVYTPLKPPPERAQASPEMLRSQPTDWTHDMAECRTLVERLGRTPVASVHPTFGPMTAGGWGLLGWKHLDHHLRQFGL